MDYKKIFKRAQIILGLLIISLYLVSCDFTPDIQNNENTGSVQDTDMKNNDDTMKDTDDTNTTKDTDETMGDTREIELSGVNYKFTMDGVENPEIRVQRGDTVRVTLTSAEGLHNWSLDEFGVSTNQVKEGEADTIEFVADKSGTFEYYCNVGNHRAMGMFGSFVVE